MAHASLLEGECDANRIDSSWRADPPTWTLPARGFFSAGHAREGSRVLGDGFGNGAVVDELAFPAAYNEAGVGENLEVMGNGGGSDPAEGDELSADHTFFGGNSLKNHEAGGVRQSL